MTCVGALVSWSHLKQQQRGLRQRPFFTSSGPYLDNGMLRAAYREMQELRSSFDASLLESSVQAQKRKVRLPAKATVSAASAVTQHIVVPRQVVCV